MLNYVKIHVRVVKQNKFGIMMKQIINALQKHNVAYLKVMSHNILSQLKVLNNV